MLDIRKERNEDKPNNVRMEDQINTQINSFYSVENTINLKIIICVKL